ncbi:MAG: EF-hand domain-containing protein [Alphaproteobacteria bacterium]|nr:EF-hand domain-containing protein [Alphaproteobacteria bacterium]
MRLFIGLMALSFSAAAAAQPPEGFRGRPHGSLFLSPMGEPFRSDDPTHDLVGDWFAAADTNHDGALTVAEFEADAARFFATLDINRDGEIDPDELTRYETQLAPEVQVGRQMGVGMGGFRRGEGGGRGGGRGGWGGRGGGPRTQEGRGSRIPEGAGGARMSNGGFDPGLEGAGRYSFLNIPEPVISADADFNRGVSLKEFVAAAGQRFVLLDANRDGRLTRDELPPLPQRHQGKFKPDKKAPKTRTLGTPIPM